MQAEAQILLNNTNTKKPSETFILKKSLSQIFNPSFHEGIVPDKLKSAVIYPIHKGKTKMLG